MDKVFVQWSDALSVGNLTIDGQHKNLIDLLNNLYTAAVELRGQKAILESLTAMGLYTQVHFTFEEALLEKCGYADIKRHRAEHLAFIEYVDQGKRRLESNDFVSSVELIKYLKEWLVHHIMVVDRQFGDVLSACVEKMGNT